MDIWQYVQKTAHLQGMKLQEQNLGTLSWKGRIFLANTLQPGHEVAELRNLPYREVEI